MAVPTNIFFALWSSSFDNLISKNKIIPKDPINTISCENWILEVPINNVKKTKIIEPTIISILGLVSSGIVNINPFAF